VEFRRARRGGEHVGPMNASNDTRNAQMPCWALMGPTASGKSRVALELGRRHAVEIVSVDSMKAYRGMDIGTAKPSRSARCEIPHHMIDVIEPRQSFNVAQYCRMAREAIREIRDRGKRPLLVGGSALYLKALMWGLFEGPGASDELRRTLAEEANALGAAALHERLKQADPEAARRIHPNDLKRIVRALEVHEQSGKPLSSQQRQFDGPPQLGCVMVGLSWPRELLCQRIEQRVDGMMAAGLLEEVRGLRGRLGPQSSQAVGYKELLSYLRGEATLEEAVRLVKQNTRQLAKHQMTWFRHFPGLQWVDASACGTVAELADRAERLFLSRGRSIDIESISP